MTEGSPAAAANPTGPLQQRSLTRRVQRVHWGVDQRDDGHPAAHIHRRVRRHGCTLACRAVGRSRGACAWRRAAAAVAASGARSHRGPRHARHAQGRLAARAGTPASLQTCGFALVQSDAVLATAQGALRGSATGAQRHARVSEPSTARAGERRHVKCRRRPHAERSPGLRVARRALPSAPLLFYTLPAMPD